MKPYYVIILVLFLSKLYGQNSNTKKLNENYDSFVLEAKEKIVNAEANYEIGRKRKAKKALEEIIDKELSFSFFNGEYSINAAFVLLKIDSVLGCKYLIDICDQLSNLRQVKTDSIKIIHSINIVKIKKKIEEMSGKSFKYPYEFIFYFEELINRIQPSKRGNKKSMITNQFDSLRVFCFGMGHNLTVMIKQDSFMYSFYGDNRVERQLKMKSLEWLKILELSKELAPESIPKMEQPGGARHYDGADYCYFTMFNNGKEYISKDYDDFRPARDLQPVVHYIRYLVGKKFDE